MPLGSRLRVSFKHKFLARELVRYQQGTSKNLFGKPFYLVAYMYVQTGSLKNRGRLKNRRRSFR